MKKRIFVVSDLHLGAPPDTHLEMCPRKNRLRLVRFLGELAESAADAPTELVINGDFIDYLCIPADDAPSELLVERAFSPEKALFKTRYAIESAYGKDPEANPFRALRSFTSAGGFLTLVLGNHDLELSMPEALEYFEKYLSGKSHSPRLRTIVDGQAYRVGNLLIEHGNRYDSWNLVNHDHMRQTRSRLSRLEHISEREAPVGSGLVIEVLNEVKRQYPWVDVLKPEEDLVVRLLVRTAGAAVRSNIRSFAKSYIRQLTNRMDATTLASRDASQINSGATRQLVDPRERPDVIDDNPPPLKPDPGTAKPKLLDTLRGLVSLGPTSTNGNFLAELEKLVKKKPEILGMATLDQETEPYRTVAERLVASDGVEFVAFGHTHLARFQRLAGGLYLNSGTWAAVCRPHPGENAKKFCHRVATSVAKRTIRDETYPTFLRFELSESDLVETAALYLATDTGSTPLQTWSQAE